MHAMSQIISYAQIVLAVILVVIILIQQSEGSLGSAFGADSFTNQFRTRRGGELYIFRATIVIAVLFVALAVANILIK